MRYNKYTIGEDLRNYSKELLFLINRSNIEKGDIILHHILIKELEPFYE